MNKAQKKQISKVFSTIGTVSLSSVLFAYFGNENGIELWKFTFFTLNSIVNFNISILILKEVK